MMKRIPNISYTTDNNLCTGCGICFGVCPTSSIEIVVKNGRFVPRVNNDTCINHKGCHKCYNVCPGVAVDFSSLKPIPEAETTQKSDHLIGDYINCYVGYSNDYDLRYHAASGGMLSQLLIWLLEKGKIDGAVVTRFKSDAPLLVETVLATKREDIIAAKGSKYAPVSLHHASELIKSAPGSRYVVVGIPCHLEGLRKQMKTDATLRKKVIALFGIYCSSGRTFHLTEYVLKHRSIPIDNLQYLAYRDEGCLGHMVARWTSNDSDSNTDASKEQNYYKEKYQSYFHPLRSFFIPKRCLFCFDHYAMLSDMSFGDIHIPPYSEDKVGINSVVTRTPLADRWINEAKEDGVISLEYLSPESLNSSQSMAKKKYNRVGAFMKIASIFCSKTPAYDTNLPIYLNLHNFIDYIQTRFQQFIGSHKLLWPFIKVLKSKPPKD